MKERYQFREQPQSVQIFKNVALFIRNKQQVHSLYWLVNITHILSLNISMLLSRPYQLGESSKETFNSYPRHVHKLSRNKHCKETQKASSKATKQKMPHYKNTVNNNKTKSNPRLSSSTNGRTSNTNTFSAFCLKLEHFWVPHDKTSSHGSKQDP